MFASRHNGTIAASLVFAVFLWGGNNTGVKYLVKFWPPVWVGSTRFLCAGLLLFALLRWTDWMGPKHSLSSRNNRLLWFRSSLVLAIYIVFFNWALHFTTASHVALYLGASPVWALLWEGKAAGGGRALARRYSAAGLALAGVVVLFWPVLHGSHGQLAGELLGLAGSVLWTVYGRQCRVLGTELSGAEITAHNMWRAGLWLLPLAMFEAFNQGIAGRSDLVLIQAYCILAGAVIAFALWTNALRYWPTSEVYLFNNLIPLSTMGWAYVWLGEPVLPTFWLAMALIIAGVLLGQARWQSLFGARWFPAE